MRPATTATTPSKMALDPTPIGVATAELMADLEDTFGPDAELAGAMVVVEIHHTFDGDHHRTEVQTTGTTGGLSASVGILTRGVDALLNPEA